MHSNYFHLFSRLAFTGLLLFTLSCERELDDLELATFPSNGDVFIDSFVGGLEYGAFGGSDVTAFDVDTDIKYSGTTSMRFSVPDFEDPAGAYAGGAFISTVGRDLTGFNTLTFWARASQPANIDVLGFGNDFGAGEFVASVNGLAVTTNWQKYYIPIPDPSKLTQERGMFFYSEGPENNRGYTFWIDEVKFENLGTIVPIRAEIFGGADRVENAETGAIYNTDGTATFNLPEGVDQVISAAPGYFTIISSNESVATVDANGRVNVLSAGEAVISATLGDREVDGSLTITSTGEAVGPPTPAPTPEVPAADVISIYSNAYENIPVDFYNGFWEFSTTQSNETQVAGDDIIRYSQLNFVGIQFTSPTVDATDVNRFHVDIWTADGTDLPASFKVLLVDLGPDNSFGGNDDSSHEITITSPTLQTGEWVSIDLPLTDFPGLTRRANLAQVVLSGDLPNVFMDNMYLYNGDPGGGGGGDDDEPTIAAPTPTQSPTNVISLFSDTYSDVPVDTWRTDWSEADFADVTVAGNATKRYTNLDFVGIETVMNQLDISGMTHVHLDVWTADATSFSIKLVDFGANGAFDGGDDVEHQVDFASPAQGQWISYDIPLSDFTGLTTRSNLAQYILVGQPTGASSVWVDNFYFHN